MKDINIMSLIDHHLLVFSSINITQNKDFLDIFCTRFGHFLLMFTYCILKPDTTYSKTYILTSDIEENQYIEKIASQCISVFKILSKLTDLNFALSRLILRGFEMSVNFFLDQLMNIILDKINFNRNINALYSKKEDICHWIAQNEMFMNAENFIMNISDKIISNFSYQDKILIESSLMVLKYIVENLKKIYKDSNLDAPLNIKICEKLMNQNDMILINEKFYKLRI